MRHALIVGGARGLGHAIGSMLLDEGWRLTVAGPNSRPEDLEARGAAFVPCDASEPEACRELVAGIAPVDALVVAAGPYHRVPLMKETPEGWRGMFQHNLDPVFFLAREVLPGMRQRGWGRILTFSMANADKLQANPFVTAHYIAKVGVLVLTRTLAKAGAKAGVTANCISPGFLDTGSAPEDELERMLKHIPAGRIGAPNDVVGVARFLLSDEAAYVNGANVHVSGAWGV